MVREEEVLRVIGCRKSPSYESIIKVEVGVALFCVERPHESPHIFTFDGNEQIVPLRAFQNHFGISLLFASIGFCVMGNALQRHFNDKVGLTTGIRQVAVNISS